MAPAVLLTPQGRATLLWSVTMSQFTEPVTCPQPTLTPAADTSPKPRKRRKKGAKPDKPYPDFPLFPHATKRWAKKILGQLHYFGSWADGPEAALKKYQEQRDDLHAGRKPRKDADGLTVGALCNQFLRSKTHLMEAGELAPQTFDDYKEVTDRLVVAFTPGRLVEDLRPDDFEKLRAALVAKKWGPVTIGNFIQRARCVFKYALDNCDVKVRYGQGFKRPSKKTLRLHRAAKGPRMFEAAELRKIIDAAGVPLKAMILLGINAGLGNADCGRLPQSALVLDGAGGWLNYPRPKTGISRRCWLWPETVTAIRAALAQRPKTHDEDLAGRVFLTAKGGSWYKTDNDNPVSKEMAKLLIELKLQREGVNFYALRHTFETIAGESRDQVAVDAIMGHADESMAALYRERISDERLKAVAESVRAWLFPKPAKVETGKGGK